MARDEFTNNSTGKPVEEINIKYENMSEDNLAISNDDFVINPSISNLESNQISIMIPKDFQEKDNYSFMINFEGHTDEYVKINMKGTKIYSLSLPGKIDNVDDEKSTDVKSFKLDMNDIFLLTIAIVTIVLVIGSGISIIFNYTGFDEIKIILTSIIVSLWFVYYVSICVYKLRKGK